MHRFLAVATAAVLLFSVPSPLSAGINDFSTSLRSESFKDEVGTRYFSKELSETAKRITVRVKLKLKQGVVRCRLEDPYGATVWEQRVEAEADFKWKDWFTARDGEWRLVLTFEDATGRYSVKMSSR